MEVNIEMAAYNLQLASKDGLTKIAFETAMTPGNIARLLNLVRQGQVAKIPITASFGSSQAQFDLEITEVKQLKMDRVDQLTGEIFSNR